MPTQNSTRTQHSRSLAVQTYPQPSSLQGMWLRYRRGGLPSRVLSVRRRVEYSDGAINIQAYSMEEAPMLNLVRSRDFR